MEHNVFRISFAKHKILMLLSVPDQINWTT